MNRWSCIHGLLGVLVLRLIIGAMGCGEVLSHGEGHPSAPPHPVVFVQRYLAAQLRLPPSEVEIAEVEEAVWPDGCLGMPTPELCPRVSTPGYRVTLRARGREYRYHTDAFEGFVSAGPVASPR